MPVNLPYLASPGSIKTALDRIKSAAAPDRVTADFMQTKLQIKGGPGASMPAFLKKIGLVQSDGTPSQLYHRFRNSQSSRSAMAESIRSGYRELFEVNEYFYELPDKDLLSLVCQVTGAALDSSTAKLTVSTLKYLKSYADFDNKDKQEEIIEPEKMALREFRTQPESAKDSKIGLNLSYTINLNLPATSDQAVFNAIFRSLKEHLLNEE